MNMQPKNTVSIVTILGGDSSTAQNWYQLIGALYGEGISICDFNVSHIQKVVVSEQLNHL